MVGVLRGIRHEYLVPDQLNVERLETIGKPRIDERIRSTWTKRKPIPKAGKRVEGSLAEVGNRDVRTAAVRMQESDPGIASRASGVVDEPRRNSGCSVRSGKAPDGAVIGCNKELKAGADGPNIGFGDCGDTSRLGKGSGATGRSGNRDSYSGNTRNVVRVHSSARVFGDEEVSSGEECHSPRV